MIKKKNNKNDWTDRDSYRESDEGGEKNDTLFRRSTWIGSFRN